MVDFAKRTASIDSLAVRRFGEDWNLDGVVVKAIFDNRATQVKFGDERYKNADMTGVNITSTGPMLTMDESDTPAWLKRGSECFRVSDIAAYTVVSIDRDNGIARVKLREA